jgi:hypothetical protein
MRVGTYNVLGICGFPKDAAAAKLGGPSSAARIAYFVEAFGWLQTDILCLEEGVTLAMAQQLADGMQRHVATFASPMDWSANGLGHGCTGHVLSRFPILESRTFSHHPAPPTAQVRAWRTSSRRRKLARSTAARHWYPARML